MPFVVLTYDVADMEFAFGETPKTQLHDSIPSDPNEEHFDEVMFADESASIGAPNLFLSLPFPSKPLSLRPNFDFRLSSSSLEPIDEEINIEDHIQVTPKGETECTPKNIDAYTTPPSSPAQQINQEDDKNKY